MKQPIAMKCSKKQFNEILPKIKHLNVSMDEDFEINPYLTNNWGGELQVGNLGEYHYRIKECKVYEEWNEKIFLEACGIEVEKTFSITESQIKTLYDIFKVSEAYQGQDYLKEWFPEAVKSEVKLQVGKWYNYNGALLNYQGKTKAKYPILRAYGIVPCNGGWKQESNFGSSPEEWREATEQEVFEALKNEAVKRGFVKGSFVKENGLTASCVQNELINNPFFRLEDNLLWIENCGINEYSCLIFENGVWAEILEQITLSEAEQQLKKKIIV